MPWRDGLLLCTIDGRWPHANFFGSHFLMIQSTLRIVLDWVPILIFFGFLIFFMRRMAPRQKNYMQASQEYMSEHLAEVRKTNELLARIATALEKHSSGDR
ncbi:MAG TPA: hypothetical protein VGC55_19340 [Dokdonella sp.]